MNGINAQVNGVRVTSRSLFSSPVDARQTPTVTGEALQPWARNPRFLAVPHRMEQPHSQAGSLNCRHPRPGR
jgi:hypothetical protein